MRKKIISYLPCRLCQNLKYQIVLVMRNILWCTKSPCFEKFCIFFFCLLRPIYTRGCLDSHPETCRVPCIFHHSASELNFLKCGNPEHEYVDLRGIRIQIHLSSNSAAANKKFKKIKLFCFLVLCWLPDKTEKILFQGRLFNLLHDFIRVVPRYLYKLF